MNNNKPNKFSYILVIAFYFSTLFINLTAQSTDSSIVDIYGQLRVEGNKIVNQDGEPIALRGMSLFWSQWMGQYYNSDCVNWLKEDWKSSVVRAAMGIEGGGYLDNPATEKNKIIAVIEACIDKGLYVIVDWHDHNAHNHQEEAIEFFKEIATLYGDKPNVIYEIFNEPQQISWSQEVKPYSEAVVGEIRAIDPDNLILVGNPTWSQDVDVAANDPLEFDNIAYSLHFYAASHKQYLRDKAAKALSKGVALFVSEFGTCEANGDGQIDHDEMNKWLSFMEENNLSWCNWSIADKEETSAALMPGASGQGGWTESQITESGKFIRNEIIHYNTVTDVNIEGENPENKVGINSIRNYPNPFNTSTTIEFSLNTKSRIKIDIYNILGENVINVVNENLSEGDYSFPVNFSELPSGNYLLSCKTETENKILKMQLLK